MTFDRVIKGNVITPNEIIRDGWVGVANSKIMAIGSGDTPAANEVLEFNGCWLAPGGIDAQTHAGSYRGLGGLEATSRGAICGGTTTMVEMPFDTPSPLSTMDLFRRKVDAVNELSFSDVALYGHVAPRQTTAEMPKLAEAGICAFKISVCEAHPVRFPRTNAQQQFEILSMAAKLGLPVGIHNEDQEIVRANTARVKATGENTLRAHGECRPVEAELAATALFAELAAAAGAHAHIVHISTPKGFEILDRYRSGGHKITGEICVHYVTFDPVKDAALGALIKVQPPIRENVAADLWKRIADGSVVCISSDHSTMSKADKLDGTIYDAGPGVPGIETLVRATFTGMETNGIDAPSMYTKVLAEGPARLFGLWPKKGAIAIGSDADIVVLEPGSFAYDSKMAHDDVNWSPWDGRKFSVRVASTFLRGTRVWDGVEVKVGRGFGRFVPRPKDAGETPVFRSS